MASDTEASPVQDKRSEHYKNTAQEQQQFEELSRGTNISAVTLRRETELDLWIDTIDMSSNPSKEQLSSYAGCALMDLRTCSLTGTEYIQSFVEDFDQWKEHHFNQLNRAFKRELLAVLASKGIYPSSKENDTQSKKLYDVAQRKCTIGSQTTLTVHTKTASLAEETYGDVKGKKPLLTPLESTEPIPRTTEPLPRTTEVPRQLSPTLAPNPHSPLPRISRTPDPQAQIPSYYWQERQTTQNAGDTGYQQATRDYNPYELPPAHAYNNDRLPPEKLVQFQKSWRKENNYTGKPYDILADKTRIFIELCRRLDIYETQYPNIFPDILEGRANMYYMHSIGPGQTWKYLYEKLDNHFNTNINHNQYWTDWTTMTFARCKQENPDKTLHEVLEIMIDKLTLAQRALGRDFQGEIPLHTTVVRACRGQLELEQAMFSIKPTCEALFSDLRSALQITIVHDPGTNFAAEEFKARAKIVGAECRQMPVEAHWAIGKIERAHTPLRRTFNILRAELDSKTDDESILQMAIKALNDTAGPDGLVPTLLIFGAYPRINGDSPASPEITARANAVRKAMRMIRQERTKTNVNRAINTRNGPRSHEVLNLPLGSEIMVWREKSGWNGPYELKAIKDQDVVIELENGPITFRCTQAKPYYRPNQLHEPTNPDELADPDESPPVQIEPPKTRRRGRPRKTAQGDEGPDTDDTPPVQQEPPELRKRGRPRKTAPPKAQSFLTQKERDDYALALKLREEGVITTMGAPFEESDRAEMDALIANSTFEILTFDPSIHYGRIFNLRLVREIKGCTANSGILLKPISNPRISYFVRYMQNRQKSYKIASLQTQSSASYDHCMVQQNQAYTGSRRTIIITRRNSR